DTDFIPEMAALGSIDIAFIPIGGTYVMDVDEAVEATKMIKPQYVIPMHQASNSLESFKNKVGAVCSSKVIILDVGNSTEIQ
ncbi:MAG: MBL fold metallo-hydrolase, partial [Bacilli bacterium]